MSTSKIILTVFIFVGGSLAAPPGGMKTKLDLTSCVKTETIDNMRKEQADCMAQSGAMSTTAASSDNMQKHMDIWRQNVVCMLKKASQNLAGANIKSNTDFISMLASNNLTTDAQQPFTDTATECFTTKAIKMEEMLKQEIKFEDWKPVLRCIHKAMKKACKPLSNPSSTDDTMPHMDVESGEDN